jgi:hypothetical protein
VSGLVTICHLDTPSLILNMLALCDVALHTLSLSLIFQISILMKRASPRRWWKVYERSGLLPKPVSSASIIASI